MSGDETCSPRSGRELLEASRPFELESRGWSWWYAGSTFVLIAAVLTGAALAPWWPARVALSVVGGLLLVRAFILYHDVMHGAILRQSSVARAVFYVYGLAVLTPPRYWRHSHNFHHANVGKPLPVKIGEFSLLTSDIGSVPLMTTRMWQQASFSQRLHYRISRHPLTLLAAYLTVFLFGFCLAPLFRDPRKFWDSGLSILLHGGLIAVLWVSAGFDVAFFAVLLPFAIAAASGAYLFFAQHNFEGMRILPIGEWSHFRAALESSSYLELGPIMNWFTGNIGYHHVHHLNSLIPFYRLPQAMAAIPELQSPVVTRLRPREMLNCLRLTLWDMESQRLVTYRTAAAGR